MTAERPGHHPWATALLARSVQGSVRGNLGGVWVRGPVPTGGAVLAPNHHSWWDGYVLWAVAGWAGADFSVLMNPGQLARFPFLRRLGALRADEVRAGVRRARGAGWSCSPKAPCTRRARCRRRPPAQAGPRGRQGCRWCQWPCA
ncbi:hypothetical protein [Deinococcus multiflagellatus]|uniref:Phospholipid/glycerol acyltransferase domain-containing protein n=1 Tax=Deinococcus multiflagellatus TaxID=1656887 RepID=A0ABW1ZKZ2_9DEIO